jgi:hypothetical protein
MAILVLLPQHPQEQVEWDLEGMELMEQVVVIKHQDP